MAGEDRGELTPKSAAGQQARLDYAWNWFNFHAEQRTKMFNYMLLGLGILATAIATTLQKGQALESLVLSAAGVLICIAFYQMDCRNRSLYGLAQDVLRDIESKLLFEADETGIAKELKKQDDRKDAKVRGWVEGQHRYWMPTVTAIFGALFLSALVYSCYLRSHPLARDSSSEALVVCCRSVDDLPQGTPKPGGALEPGKETGIPLDGTGSIAAWHWFPIGGGLLLVVGGVLFFVYGKRLLGTALVAGGMAAAALPGFSIPLHAEFHVDPSIEFKLPEDLKLTLLKAAGQTQPALLESGRFGGFGEGVEAFDCKQPASAEIVNRVNSALRLAQTRSLQPIVLLVGGTDRKPLSSTLRARYETNTGLARARVAAVERCLAFDSGGRSADALPPEIIRLVTGPSYTPSNRESSELAVMHMAEDREVRVFVIGLATKGQESTTPQPRR